MNMYSPQIHSFTVLSALIGEVICSNILMFVYSRADK